MFEVRVTKLETKEDSNVIGLASMVVDGKFAFNSMRVIKSDNTERGFFVSMPSYKTKDGKYVDFFYPVSSMMTDSIAAAVGKAMETGAPVTIGEGETQVSSFVTPTHYQNNPTQVAKANLRFGDMICNSVILRRSAEGNVFVSYPSYESKSQKNEDGSPKRISYCNPITAEFRNILSDDLIDKYGVQISNKYAVKEQAKSKEISYTANVPDAKTI